MSNATLEKGVELRSRISFTIHGLRTGIHLSLTASNNLLETCIA